MKEQQYIKKPIQITAVPIGTIIDGTCDFPWVQELVSSGNISTDSGGVTVLVQTLEGPMQGTMDDYLIRGVRGEVYICRKDIFEETYEPVKAL